MNAVAGWLAHWLQMGGYAGFVWPAYGIAAILLGGLALFSWRRHRRSEAELTHLSGGDLSDVNLSGGTAI